MSMPHVRPERDVPTRGKHTRVFAVDEPEFGACHSYEIRSAAKVFVCGVTCQPGGANCNNYCNHNTHAAMPDEPAEDGRIFGTVRFQKGPIKEHGVNGIHNEDLIAIVIDRLQGFQKTEFSCRENALAITKLEEALHWLQHRTAAREARGVEGTNQV